MPLIMAVQNTKSQPKGMPAISNPTPIKSPINQMTVPIIPKINPAFINGLEYFRFRLAIMQKISAKIDNVLPNPARLITNPAIPSLDLSFLIFFKQHFLLKTLLKNDIYLF